MNRILSSIDPELPASNPSMTRPLRRRRWPLAAGGACALVVAAALCAATRSYWYPPAAAPASLPDDEQAQYKAQAELFPLTPISASPFENTRPEVGYVGSKVCQSCHEDEHESFRHTGMGRSMARVDLTREPPDGQFDHLPSQRRYQVLRRDGWMWHRELLITDGPDEVIVSEFPVKYVTGSGRHSLTYLIETDGFLIESPITWYRARQAWGMSPGYDQAGHSAFQRAVGEGCLICHAGRSEAIGGSLHRMRIIEDSIGCERCHGPGALHVKKHSSPAAVQSAADGAIDYSIVNPAHLSRELGEAVCQQCHLRSSATIISRGRKIDDFRPGLPLADFRQDYTLKIPDKQMTVVGHVEQMHQSRCFQKSDKFTCVTCHNPHGEPAAEQRIAHYQAVCRTCHQAEHCTVDRQRLAKESAENNCVQCHMPTSPTDIPHLAFTHHRVGLHEPAAAEQEPAAAADSMPGALQPFLDLSRLSEIDRKRSLGLGYIDLAIHEDNPARRSGYQEQALALLSEVRAVGLQDGYVDSALASLRFDTGKGDVLPFAFSALSDPNIGGMERSNALFLIADAYFHQERYEEAIGALAPLAEMRRHSVQWLLKAQCEQALENEQGAAEALLKASQIDPRNAKAHRFLADHFRKAGNLNRAEWHEKMASASE